MDPAPTALGGRELVLPAVFAALLVSVFAFAVGFDQGAIGLLLSDRAAESGGLLHEFFHDGRHLLGVPCH